MMYYFISQNWDVLLAVFVAATVIVGIILIWYYSKSRNSENNHNHICEQLNISGYENIRQGYDYWKDECSKLQNENSQLQSQKEKLYVRITNLQSEIDKLKAEKAMLESRNRELARNNDELDMLIKRDNAKVSNKNDSIEVVSESTNKIIPKYEQKNTSTAFSVQVETINHPMSGQKVVASNETIMYAGFPRYAGDKIYFSDIKEKRTDDSFFEIYISSNKIKSSFKPLDFMKIRNYDDAMNAMITEGAKPNVASSVISIEPGSAHLEGKDWFIDKQAKIKLA